MTNERLVIYIEQMTQAAEELLTFVAGTTKDEFLQDIVKQRAVGMNLLKIGEAAAQLVEKFPDFTEVHPEMAWAEMRGMRNRIAHGYLSINLDTVWSTVMQAVPQLLSQLHALRHIHAQGE